MQFFAVTSVYSVKRDEFNIRMSIIAGTIEDTTLIVYTKTSYPLCMPQWYKLKKLINMCEINNVILFITIVFLAWYDISLLKINNREYFWINNCPNWILLLLNFIYYISYFTPVSHFSERMFDL